MVRAAPFLKWAGGKRALLSKLLRYVPRDIDTYYEPFIGGGALFFALAAEVNSRRFRQAVLADTNDELISCYQTIKKDPEGVLAALESHRAGEAYYYDVRAQDPASLSDEQRAARTIFLNRNGYNGLFRVNQSGQFNVPFGKYATVRTVKAEAVKAVSAVLRDVKLQVCDFSTCVAKATPRDFVYFDPPYVPVSPTASFTAYARGGFGEAQQQALADLLRGEGRGGIRALLSNSDCPTSRRLYEELPLTRVKVARPINSVAARRGTVSELLVRSFDYSC